VGWWDASDASSITQSGGLVSQWNDKSGQNNHATASGTARPTATASGLNGLQVLTFDGADDSMQITGTARTNETWFVVGRANVVPGAVKTNSFLMDASSGFGLTAVTKGDGGTGSIEITLGGFVTGTTRASVSIPTNTPVGPSVLSAVRSSASGGVLLQNGVSQATCTTSNSFAIARISGPTTVSVNGYIAEVVVYNTALSTTDRVRVEAYLAAKWGISGVHAQATATNDPVGYWRDKSGNNRHATQATGGSRPTIASYFAAKSALSFDGSDDHLRADAAATVFNSADQSASMIAVVTPSTSSAAVVASAGPANGSSSLAAMYTGTPSYWLRDTNATGDQAISAVRAGGEKYMMVGVSSETARSLAINGAVVSSVTQTIGTLSVDRFTVGALGRAANTSLYNGRVAELLVYARTLSGSERQRIERYLASKWGITLAPIVSNADAQDWVNRVYANGGTVSSTTASAVNTFCSAIDEANIRDRFYRLNLFCGTGLSAALVPLYRGPSLSGTQYGDTTDTNNNFVSGDYTETGSSGGLQASSNATKFLATGLIPFSAGLSEQNYHNSGYFPATLNTNAFFVSQQSNGGNSLFAPAFGTVGMYARFGGGSNSGLENASLSARSGHLIGQRSSGTGVGYRNGANINATSNTSGSSAFASGQTALYVFATNNSGTAQTHWSGRACMYSVGSNFTDAQALAFYNAVQAFQTALGRQL
jgi:hypothetical protein